MMGISIWKLLIILGIASLLDRFLEITFIASAFKGIKAAVGLLIFDAGLNMLKKMAKKLLPRAIMICSAAAMLAISLFSLRFSSIALMLLAGIVSLSVFCMQDAAIRKGGESK